MKLDSDPVCEDKVRLDGVDNFLETSGGKSRSASAEVQAGRNLSAFLPAACQMDFPKEGIYVPAA